MITEEALKVIIFSLASFERYMLRYKNDVRFQIKKIARQRMWWCYSIPHFKEKGPMFLTSITRNRKKKNK